MENVHRQLINEIRLINKDFRLARRRAHHAIDKIKVSIGPDKWNQSHRIAIFLAIKDAEIMNNAGESLFDDDENMVEIGEEDFE